MKMKGEGNKKIEVAVIEDKEEEKNIYIKKIYFIFYFQDQITNILRVYGPMIQKI